MSDPHSSDDHDLDDEPAPRDSAQAEPAPRDDDNTFSAMVCRLGWRRGIPLARAAGEPIQDFNRRALAALADAAPGGSSASETT